MQHLLEAVDFRNPSRAREDLARLCGIPDRISSRIQSLLASVPDPDEALHFLERLLQDYPAAFHRLTSSPAAALHCLISTFSYSRFLSEAVLQRPEWLLQAADAEDLYRMLSAEEFAERLAQFKAAEGDGVLVPVTLARFR